MTLPELPADFVAGNVYDKYGSRNPIVRRMMSGFFTSVKELLRGIDAQSILELGCGEGHVGSQLQALYPGSRYRGIDIDPKIITEARTRFPNLKFETHSIYDIDSSFSDANLVVALEVFEHLDDPVQGMDAVLLLPFEHLLISVPREPIWRILNVARGKYVVDLGNTPGHVNHWSKLGFTRFLSHFGRLEILAVRSPFPWTMVLCRNR
jgi:2-polyprenyl-3-methyl-5-hydroxy-6-metoxy-1,4-benzoquinol methylase